MSENNSNIHEKYIGLRAILLTRVSTPIQAKMYSHAAQERIVQEKLIEPLGLQLVDIVKDTYSGLEYRYREALDKILRRAEEDRDFDLLVMDVLDRGLGRKALARELYRMQLKELGITILSTDPEDHADDDTLEGQVMRFFRGYKAEQEIKDLIRRTSNGRREKALGNPEKNIPQKVIGQGHRIYGYKHSYDMHGKRAGLEPNNDIVHIDQFDEKWTEVKVIRFIFESAAKGMTIRKIAMTLNEKGIPSPYVTKGIKAKNIKETPIWQPGVVARKLKDSTYWGEHLEYKTRSRGKKPGRKYAARERTAPEDQIVIQVPAIVTK